MVPKVRATHCLHCGESFQRPARRDRIYCGESCRVLAYCERRQAQEMEMEMENGALSPRSAVRRKPLLHCAMAGLADLQAQIVHIGHSLQAEEQAERKQRASVSIPVIDHEAEKEELRRQLAEVTASLSASQNRIAELEGIVSEQRDQIQELKTIRSQPKEAPAMGMQLALQTLAREATREEERWLTDLGDAIRSGYDPKSDRLLDLKFDELCAEQDLADAEETAGGDPSAFLHHRGTLLWPMAMWAALKARQDEVTGQSAGLPSRRQQLRLGQKLRPTDEVYLCELSAARTRDLKRRLQASPRR